MPVTRARPDTPRTRILTACAKDGTITRERIAHEHGDDAGDTNRFIAEALKKRWLIDVSDDLSLFKCSTREQRQWGRADNPITVTAPRPPPKNAHAAPTEIRRTADGGFAPAVTPLDEIREVAAYARRIEAEGGTISDETREALRVGLAVHGAEDWRLSVPSLFPRTFNIDFAPYHEEFWDWVFGIRAGIAPSPFVGVWGRDGGKSSVVEAAMIMLGALGIRTYCWLVCSTQDNADVHVDSIEALITSSEVAAAYPGMATKDKGKFGPKEWRKNRLVTEHGFIIDAIGLDIASRGRRFEEQRAGVIAFDDIDDQHDTPRATEKRIATITRKILPAGNTECAVMFVQNMIHGRSIAARLADMPGAPEADYLSNRIVSGPIKLVDDLETHRREFPGRGYEIVGGTATWPARGIEGAQVSMDRFGLTSFLIECQHEEGSLGGGIFEHLDFDLGAGITVSDVQIPQMRAVSCWVDPAVSSTDRSDSMGIVVGGLGTDGLYYMLWAWERVTSPLDALRTAIMAAVEFGAQVLGVETDQGGDTWEVVYRSALQSLLDDPTSLLNEMLNEGAHIPRYDYRKAGSVGQSKSERASRMLVDYELGKVRHRDGTTKPLESGLKRFPVHKPFDVVDSAYWVWRWLAEKGGERNLNQRFQIRAAKGAPVGDTKPTF